MLDLDDRDAVVAAFRELVVDSAGAAKILGLSQRNTIRTYRGRKPDFPKPLLELGSGRCKLWLRSDIEAWRREHPGRRST